MVCGAFVLRIAGHRIMDRILIGSDGTCWPAELRMADYFQPASAVAPEYLE